MGFQFKQVLEVLGVSFKTSDPGSLRVYLHFCKGSALRSLGSGICVRDSVCCKAPFGHGAK